MATDRDQEMRECPPSVATMSRDSRRNTLLPVLERSKSADVLRARTRGDQAADERKDLKNKMVFNVKEKNYHILVQECDEENHVQELTLLNSHRPPRICAEGGVSLRGFDDPGQTEEETSSSMTLELGDKAATSDCDLEDKITTDVNNNNSNNNNNNNNNIIINNNNINNDDFSHGAADSESRSAKEPSPDLPHSPHQGDLREQDCDWKSRDEMCTLPNISRSTDQADLQEQEQEQQRGRESQMVVMRLKTPPEEGSEVKPTKKTCVGDLVNLCPDLGEVQLQPVAVDGSMYNRWARLPREESTDSDETCKDRRPLTLRTLQYSGSHKAASLVHTIAQTNPALLDPPATAPPPIFRAGMAPTPAFPPFYPRSLSLPESRRPAEVTASKPMTREDQSSLPLSTRVAEYLPFLTSPLRRGESIEEGDERNAVTVLSAPCARRPALGSVGNASLQDRLLGGSAQRQSPAQALPMNTASLLFSQDVDKRNRRYSYVKKRLHLRPAENSTKETSPIDGRPSRGPKSAGEGKENGVKQTEVRRVQFIDLAEVKKVLLQQKGSGASNPRCASVLDVVRNRNSYSLSAKSLRHGGGGSYGGGYRHLGRGVKGTSPLQHPFIPIGLPLDISSAKLTSAKY